MNSPTMEKDCCVLRSDVRETNGCRYGYRLLLTQDAAMPYTVEATFCDAAGYATERRCSLPVLHEAAAQRLYRTLTRNLVTPIDLPYIIEDLTV